MTPASVGDSRRSITCLVALSCLFFGYVAIRAAVVPITWDEAHNYLEFTRKGILWPTHLRAMSANNHYLNSWLTYATTGVFGLSELTLRLPTLAAYGLFLYSTSRLCYGLSSLPLRASAFVVLNANPYLLDFFSLSRGYGIAYGLLGGSLWYLRRFIDSSFRARYARRSLGLAVLAVYAHLTLIHFALALTVVVVLATAMFATAGPGVSRRVTHALRTHAVDLSGVALALAPVAFIVRELRAVDAFFYGGTTGFWQDSVLGVFGASLYGRPDPAFLGRPALPLSGLLGALALLLTAIAAWVSIRRLSQRPQSRDLYLAALVVLASSCALASIAQHYVLDVLYLTDRTALYLLIVGTFVFVVLADIRARSSTAWRYCLPAAAVLMGAHLVACLNLTYVFEWKVEADVKHMLADAAEAASALPAGGRPTVLGLNLEFEAPINFYRLVDGLTWLNPADRRMKFHPLSDLYLYTDSDWRAVDADAFVVLKRYALSNSLLLRRKTRPSRFDVRIARTLDFDAPGDSSVVVGATSREVAYSGAWSGVTDKHHRRTERITFALDRMRDAPDRSLVTASAMVWMRSVRNATAQLVVVFERNGKPYLWQSLTLQDGVRKARTWSPVRITAFVPPSLRQGDRLSVYVANRRSRVYVDDLTMGWITATWPAAVAGASDRGLSRPPCGLCQAIGQQMFSRSGGRSSAGRARDF